MRHCPKCNTDKDDSKFYISKKKDGTTRISGYCKPCFRIHYISPRNKAEQAARSKGRWAKLKAAHVDLPGEVWYPITGYEDLYEISNFARIKSLRPAFYGIKKIAVNKRVGYCYVNLTDDDGNQKHHYMHRLMAQQFIPNPLNLAWVNHKDGDKVNNVVSNLEWTTPKQNHAHAINVLGKHGGIYHKKMGDMRAAMTTKLCKRCSTVKNKDEFHKSHTARSGLTSYCKPCIYKLNEKYDAIKKTKREAAKKEKLNE